MYSVKVLNRDLPMPRRSSRWGLLQKYGRNSFRSGETKVEDTWRVPLEDLVINKSLRTPEEYKGI
jgi:hypothetical protein